MIALWMGTFPNFPVPVTFPKILQVLLPADFLDGLGTPAGASLWPLKQLGPLRLQALRDVNARKQSTRGGGTHWVFAKVPPCKILSAL